jgi:hypothetical protein
VKGWYGVVAELSTSVVTIQTERQQPTVQNEKAHSLLSEPFFPSERVVTYRTRGPRSRQR